MVTAVEIIESVKTLTVQELVDLTKSLQDEFDVKPSFGSPSQQVNGNDAQPVVEEIVPTAFDVVLTVVGDKKVAVIKAVREVTTLGLAEAKALVDAAPNVVKTNLSREEADALKVRLESEGATVEVKPAG